MSRRALLQGAAGAGATVVAAGLIKPGAAWAAEDPRPQPIPGIVDVGGEGYHFYAPGPLVGDDPMTIDDQSTITDFDGIVACSHIQSTGVGTDTATGIETPLAFDTDMRFMQGTYVAEDGQRRQGSFGFI